MGFALTLSLLVLASLRAGAEPPAETAASEVPIKVLSVRTSSHLKPWKGYTFDASNLVDGRVDTSWQPAKNDTLGVGQWIELDLGGYYEITRIELEQGLQKDDPKLGDLFCRNNRLAEATVWLDDGTRGGVDFGSPESAKTLKVLHFYRGWHTSQGHEVRTAARRLRIIVAAVIDPVDWDDLAVAEVRVFGRSVASPPAGDGAFAWDGPKSWPFRVAVSDHCAVGHKQRTERFCTTLTGAIGSAHFGLMAKPIPPLTAADLGKDSFELTLDHLDITFSRPKPDAPWVVTEVRVNRKLLPPDHAGVESASYSVPDYDNLNPCWEKLGVRNEQSAE